ncbi:hypothetical protein [Aquimarina sp. 2304DJ70-9]|uniref:hypothetical protein n=1 Tax=Aquimarina penaris TaxID=3231044 RepID=UPI003462C61B
MSNNIELLILLRRIAFGTECIAAVTGLFFLFNHRIKGALRWFPVFLTYIFLNDLIGLKTKPLFPNANNLILYNISTTITFIFIFYIYYQYCRKQTNKRLILLFLSLYISTLFIAGWIENYLHQLQSIPFLLGSLLLMTSIIFYYIELLKTEQTQEITRDLLFWISAGLLIYYIGKTPFRVVRDYYANLSMSDHSILFILNSILTIIMNSCFIIGFIMNKKQLPLIKNEDMHT